jgi:predicted HTH transcriptional regulator
VGARAPTIPISLVRNARPGDHPLKPESFHYEVHAVIKEFGKISNKELQQYFSETNKRTLSAAVSGLYLGNYIKKEPSFGPSASPIYIYNSDTGHRPNKYVSKRMLKTAILAIDHIHNTGQDITPKKFRERSGIINQQTGKILLELIETGFLEKIGKKTYRKSQKWLDAESSHHRARL